MQIVIAISLVIFATLFISLVLSFLKSVKVAANPIMCKVAAAGDIKRNTPSSKSLIMDVSASSDIRKEFNASLKQYDHYVVSGYSMLLASIHTNDIVFVNPDEMLDENTNCPCVVVLKRDEKALQRAALENDNAKYKLRRAWAVCNITDDTEKVLDSILESDKFFELKNKNGEHFLTNAEMKKDFNEYRKKRYIADYPSCNDASSPYHKVVISTTLHANPSTQHHETFNKVTFSIHPLILVQGVVEKSYRTIEE